MKRRLDPFTIAAIVHLLFCIALLVFAFCFGEPMPEEPQMVKITMPAVKNTEEPAARTTVFTPAPEMCVPTETVEVLAKMVYGEAVGCSTTEQAAVVWCVLNRVDAGYGNIVEVATAPNQFVGYRPENPVEPHIAHLVWDVLQRWYAEKTHGESSGRVLEANYLWFSGDGRHNHFRNQYIGGDVWDWSLPSPYEEGASYGYEI